MRHRKLYSHLKITLVLLALLVAVPSFALFSPQSVIVNEPVLQRSGQCQNGLNIKAASYDVDGVTYTLYVAPSNHKALLIKHDEDGDMVEAAFGVMVESDGKSYFTKATFMERDKVLELYPNGPCQFLTEKEA